jgi:hypothetical protein
VKIEPESEGNQVDSLYCGSNDMLLFCSSNAEEKDQARQGRRENC